MTGDPTPQEPQTPLRDNADLSTKALFVLYYKQPPHTPELLGRARHQLFTLKYMEQEAIGPPAVTLNLALSYANRHLEDWIVPFDPHLLWEPTGVDEFFRALRDADRDHRVGYVSYPVYQHGPLKDCGSWLGSLQYSIFRLLAAFRVDALKSIGGFVAAQSGRNWMWRTEMALSDQGWRHMDHGVVVASHHDPDLTLEQHLLQTFYAGRDAMDLFQHGRGHPLLNEGTVQLAGKVALLAKANWDNVYWQCRELLRLLGGGLALGLLPREPVKPALLQVRIHEDLEPTKEEPK